MAQTRRKSEGQGAQTGEGLDGGRKISGSEVGFILESRDWEMFQFFHFHQMDT